MPLHALMVALLPQAAPAVPATMVVGGTIAVARPAAGAPPGAPSPGMVASVEGALADAGFLVIPHARHARQVARISVTRTPHGTALARGRSTEGAMVGAGTVSIPLGGSGGKTRVGQMMATEMTLSITPRGGSAPVWEGSAVTYQVTGTRGDEPAAVAAKLAGAIARNFGGPSGLSVAVP